MHLLTLLLLNSYSLLPTAYYFTTYYFTTYYFTTYYLTTLLPYYLTTYYLLLTTLLPYYLLLYYLLLHHFERVLHLAPSGFHYVNSRRQLA